MSGSGPSRARFEGCLLGQITGDCLGLPREGLTTRRADRLFGEAIRHSLIAGRGLGSDDTELACFAAQSFLAHPRDADAFERSQAWKLRLWLIGLPAGLGLATLRSVLKLWIGFPPSRSGVWSAGNGPAIRGPVLGLACWDDDQRLREYVKRATRLTHTDPKAERGALAAAVAARYAATHGPGDFSASELLRQIGALFPEDDGEAKRWLALLAGPAGGGDAAAFSEAMGLRDGVSGYSYHTIPAVLWAWLQDPFDYRGGMERVIRLGGDSDTTGAIFGGICGAAVGVEGIPPEWLEGVCEYPGTVDWVRRLGQRLHASATHSEEARPLPLAWPALLIRNPLFLLIVLFHGFRRLLPPY